MKPVLAFLWKCVENPKTTAAGVALIGSGIGILINDPSSVSLVTPGNPILLILTGIGFVVGADQPDPKVLP